MKKEGQIWIETLIYTLVALVMIGLVLSFATPKIEEMQDRAIIDQSIEVLKKIDSTILSLDQGGAGNKREIKLEIKKGTLFIDSASDLIYFEIDSKSEYSEPGKEIDFGGIKVYTQQKGEFNKVSLTSNYSGMHDITYNGEEELRSITKAPSPYNLFISHNGREGKTIIDITI